jgi:putative transposase
MIRIADETDLTDDQWQILDPNIPKTKQGDRPRSLEMREVLNAIFYLLANGIKWRKVPYDLPIYLIRWDWY